MSLDLFIVLACAILGLMAHGARHQAWLGWILRIIIGIFFAAELAICLGWPLEEAGAQIGAAAPSQWAFAVTATACSVTGLLLFQYARLALSYVLTALERIVSGRVFIDLFKRKSVWRAFFAERIFSPASMPHLVSLWIYATTACFLLGSIDPASVKLPLLPIPIPVPLEQLFSYNGLGLVLLSLCGVGIFITREPVQALARLGLVKPTWPQVGIGIALVFLTFGYDYVWSLFTHGMAGNLASKLSNYNAGSFTAGGGTLTPALVLALFTGLCAGVGEETLIRGALQPVFGILPAAALHGLLHGQFEHAPIFLLQVTGWSALMGIVKRYTNTTTTIIGHATFNFLTTFLFAFCP